MPKINHEEYEILKELDDKWKWIARDKDNTLVMGAGKNERYLDGWFPPENVGDSLVVDETNAVKDVSEYGNLFQFIQWEDESPYNIQKLIEEYEKDYKGSWEHAIEFSGEVFGESEETEVKKDIEWLKDILFDENVIRLFPNDIEKLHELINQLDKPEVLSQEFIDKYKVDYDNWMPAVPIVHLQNLLVPKRHKEETNTLHDGEIRLQIGFDGSTETSYATSVGEALEILTDYDSSYHVIEKPTVPQFVADWHVQNKYYLLGAKFERIADWEDKRVVDWYRQCSGRHNNKLSNAQETIALMDLVGYEVEEEQKYYALIKGHENIYSGICFWIYDTEIEELLIDDAEIYPDVTAGYMIKATKDEWANLGINDDNADFVKVEELEE